jgi:hypothetical protein
MVSTTRKFSVAMVSLTFGIAACQSDSIAGFEPADAGLAKNGGAGGGGNARWQDNETWFDASTNTFHFKAVGLGKNQSFTVNVSASVTTTYDCVNPGASLHIPNAFQNIAETISSSATFHATRNGQVTGSVQLDLDSQGELRCPPPQQSGEPLLPGWTTSGWQAANIVLESLGGVSIEVQPGFLPNRYY